MTTLLLSALKLYAQNAKQLRFMAERAAKVAPKKYRGYSADDLARKADEYEAIAEGRACPRFIGKVGRP